MHCHTGFCTLGENHVLRGPWVTISENVHFWCMYPCMVFSTAYLDMGSACKGVHGQSVVRVGKILYFVLFGELSR